MKPRRTWIVVADGARARIAVSEGPARRLRPAIRYDLAVPLARTSALVSDRPGRQADAGGVGTHATSPRTDAHTHMQNLFALQVAREVEVAAARRLFDRLVLVAPPAAMGRLRAVMSPRVKNLVSAEVAKDLTHLALPALERHLKRTVLL